MKKEAIKLWFDEVTMMPGNTQQIEKFNVPGSTLHYTQVGLGAAPPCTTHR